MIWSGRSDPDRWPHRAHPLSAIKINLGSSSLRGHGLRLALAAATTPEDHEWVREQAVNLLRSSDQLDINHAAQVLADLPPQSTRNTDANLLAGHQYYVVRQAASVLSIREPDRYSELLLRLASDHDRRVRQTLAQAVANAIDPKPAALVAVLDILAQDPRHSVRSQLVTS